MKVAKTDRANVDGDFDGNISVGGRAVADLSVTVITPTIERAIGSDSGGMRSDVMLV